MTAWRTFCDLTVFFIVPRNVEIPHPSCVSQVGWAIVAAGTERDRGIKVRFARFV
jgi:hypothetical protein